VLGAVVHCQSTSIERVCPYTEWRECSTNTRHSIDRKRSTVARWWLILCCCLAVAFSGVVIRVMLKWPFTREAVTVALQDRFARAVEIRNFRRTYFPPGFIAEGVSFLHREHKNLPPLITVQTLTLQGSYAGLFSVQKRVGHVQVAGLHVFVPPKSTNGKSHSVMPLTDSPSTKSVGIDEIKADGVVLEFMSSQHGKEPFRLEVQKLTLKHVGEGGPISFQAGVLSTEPPGEIRSSGQFGPWNSEEPGSTPVSGSYNFDDANLGVYGGVSGTLSSQGKFNGTLDNIEATGKVEIPNFRVASGTQVVHLSTQFQAAVDAKNGDTDLENIQSYFDRTSILSKGTVTGHPGQHGKTALLEMTVINGRIEDLLRLFTEEKRPSMTGSLSLHARVEVPPGPPGFLRKLHLEGDFGVAGGRFTNALVQVPVNRLSESARGETKKQQANDPETVVSNLKGHVSVKDGIAQLSGVTFSTSGTSAEMRGTYNLVNRTIDLLGVLHTNGKLSDTTSGFKAVVLKAIVPFLKKKSVTTVPFTITGTSTHPAFALDFDGKRKL
jgi:hypothetical protein